jgi:hypothetical protein
MIIGVGVGIGIGIEGKKMGFGHEKQDVYRTSIAYARENQPQYTVGIDPDPDSDPDTDGNREHGTAHPVHFVDGHYLFTTPQHFRYELNQRIAYSWRVSRLGGPAPHQPFMKYEG